MLIRNKPRYFVSYLLDLKYNHQLFHLQIDPVICVFGFHLQTTRFSASFNLMDICLDE